jgi:hypothetical protein
MKPEFPGRYYRKAQISNLIKIRPVGAELFYADGRTKGRCNMTKLIIAFRATDHFCNFIFAGFYKNIS